MDGVEALQRTASGGGELRLIDVWRIVWRGRLIILLCSAIGCAMAVGYALSINDIYRGHVVLAPNSEEGPGGFPSGALANVAALAGIRTPGKVGVSKADEAIAVLRSRRFTESFIRREGLLPVLLPKVEESLGLVSRVMEGLRAWVRDPADAGGKDAERRAEEEHQRQMLWDAYKIINGIRQIEVDREIGLVTLAVDWTDPVLAAEWANKLVTYINHESRAREIEAAEKNIAYLQEQVDITVETERRRLLFNLIEGETRRIMLANSRDEFAFRIIDPAVVPQEKAGPKRAMIATAGLMGGMLLGFLIVVIRHAGRDSTLISG